MRNADILLGDILDTITSIRDRAKGLSQEDFAANETVVKATLYDLMSIGEAAKNLPEGVRNASPEVPWKEVIATRDFLAHGYFRVEPERIWRILDSDLEVLRNGVERVRGSGSDAWDSG